MILCIAMLAAEVLAPTGDAKMSAQPTFVVSKWQGRIYGFAEADFFADSTQSLVDLQGNQLLAAPHTTALDAGRVQFSTRNTRLGITLSSPETSSGLRAVGTIESDFLGTNAAPGAVAGASESSFYNGVFRMRHAWARLETPVVTIQGGQTWTLLAFNPVFTPGSVSLQGLPNEVFQRTPQLRISRLFDLSAARLELAVAASRPAQRDAALPDFVAGARVEFSGWQGYKSTASAAGGLTGLQLAVSGTVKRLRALKQAPANDTDFTTLTGSAIVADAIVPIIPATKASKANALTFVGEITSGSGWGDNFTGLSMGVAAPPSMDGGDAAFRADTGALETLDWKSAMANLQYYTPLDDGALWINLLYTVGSSGNAYLFAKPGAAFGVQHYAAIGALYDPAPGFRAGIEWSWTEQRFTDGSERVNRRAQLLLLYNFL